MLTEDEINANIASIKTVFERFLAFGPAGEEGGPTDAVMVNNADWLDALGYIELLRTVGPHFTVNRMLAFDSVKLRLEREQPLTFLEFNYMILQAYDFRELARSHGAQLQMGGSDQWGNIINGIELARRTDGSELFGLTTPLLTTASGNKMGKTAAGAVWLNADQLSHHDYWQYWRNVDDADVGRFLRLFTDIALDEISGLESLTGAEINQSKITLANAATSLCRGVAAAESAAETARKTFEQGVAGGDLPTISIPSNGMTVAAILKDLGFVASNNEAKRKITEGAVRIGGVIVADPLLRILPGDDKIAVQMGAKRHGVIAPE